MNIYRLLSAFLVIALSIILLLHLFLILFYGAVYIYENNTAVCISEIILGIAVFYIGIKEIISTVEDYKNAKSI